MELLHKLPNIEIRQITNKIIYCNWVGPQKPDSITGAGVMILEIIKEGNFNKVLNDNSRVTGPWNTSVPYTLNHWFPSMIDSGLEHFAWVYSPNIFANLSARRATPTGSFIKSFYNYNDALNWLSAKP